MHNFNYLHFQNMENNYSKSVNTSKNSVGPNVEEVQSKMVRNTRLLCF